jgi:hypothetical protein
LERDDKNKIRESSTSEDQEIQDVEETTLKKEEDTDENRNVLSMQEIITSVSDKISKDKQVDRETSSKANDKFLLTFLKDAWSEKYAIYLTEPFILLLLPEIVKDETTKDVKDSYLLMNISFLNRDGNTIVSYDDYYPIQKVVLLYDVPDSVIITNINKILGLNDHIMKASITEKKSPQSTYMIESKDIKILNYNQE